MRRRRLFCFVLVVIAALMLMAPAARAQSSSCVDCHFANPAAPERDHLGDWERSAHGRTRVGCEQCHGGDAASYDASLVHRGVRHSGNAASRVHRRNLPATWSYWSPSPRCTHVLLKLPSVRCCDVSDWHACAEFPGHPRRISQSSAHIAV